MVQITVFEKASGRELTLEIPGEPTIASVKEQINQQFGVPTEYQQLLLDDVELEDTQQLPNTSSALSPYEMNYTLDGSGPKIDTGRFELKIRLMCWTVCAIDEKWNQCQLFCVHCQCSVM